MGRDIRGIQLPFLSLLFFLILAFYKWWPYSIRYRRLRKNDTKLHHKYCKDDVFALTLLGPEACDLVEQTGLICSFDFSKFENLPWQIRSHLSYSTSIADEYPHMLSLRECMWKCGVSSLCLQTDLVLCTVHHAAKRIKVIPSTFIIVVNHKNSWESCIQIFALLGLRPSLEAQAQSPQSLETAAPFFNIGPSSPSSPLLPFRPAS